MPASWFNLSWLRVTADLLRVVSLVSIVVAGVAIGLGDGIRFVVLTGVLLAVRIFGMVALFDVLLCLVTIVATWAAVLDWYVSIVWMDEVVHLLAIGVLAAACYLVLSRSGALPSLSVLARRRHRLPVAVVITALGFSIACLWEFLEWIGEQLSPQTIHVGYADTISDLALGGSGAVVAGLLVALCAPALAGAQERAEVRQSS